MEKATFYIRPGSFLLNNVIFNAKAFGNRMKTDGYPFVELKRRLAESGIELSTQDINKPEDSKYIFCLDYPHHFKDFKKKDGQRLYLIISEPEIYSAEAWDPEYHKNFDKIFTYNSRFGFNDRYKKYTFAIDFDYYRFPEKSTFEDFKNRKLCALVASAILSVPQSHPDSLLYERYKIITWFGKHHPEEFGFYSSIAEERDFFSLFRGQTILKKVLPGSLFKRLIRFRQRHLIQVYKVFSDPFEKVDEIKNYRFYICYENTKNNEGYVTEKIFDCFYSHCIPIYLGASNIQEIIPPKCYIDFRNFKTIKDLYNFIANMGYSEYEEYTKNIDAFLLSADIKKFEVANYSHTIIKEMQLD